METIYLVDSVGLSSVTELWICTLFYLRLCFYHEDHLCVHDLGAQS